VFQTLVLVQLGSLLPEESLHIAVFELVFVIEVVLLDLDPIIVSL
jgi:hypothetical protein